MNVLKSKPSFFVEITVAVLMLIVLPQYGQRVGYAAPRTNAPVPLLSAGHPVDWWFVFKFNSGAFPGCGGSATRTCPFGGTVQPYRAFGQQYVYASSERSSLQKGTGCVGDTTADPLGATVDEVYNNDFHYVPRWSPQNRPCVDV